MIVSMHVATGAAGGALAGSRLRAALLGLVLHGICDRIPHMDLTSRRFEIRSGLALLGLLAAAAGREEALTRRIASGDGTAREASRPECNSSRPD